MRMNAVLSNPKHPEYGQFTEAFPVVAFAKQLEDKSRKIMEIMECVIQPDGSRQYIKLYR